MRDEKDIISVFEGDVTFEGAVVLQFGPTVAARVLHLVVAASGELDGVVGTMDDAGEAIEGGLTTVLIELDIGGRHRHVVAGCLNDAPSALDTHIGNARSLGRRIRL
ncbi:hypothetical protein SAMN02745126_06395 [Enhydrobacter aerosaccus]|uniref:Uncharacterized protein n=1 Tax=Enhydrobacter aerosaccus TaxID=225324 RepID=A0A1T4TK39_9HYPH|nr:hypothetical protein SAMN02745126_06395 [Enhydrobacter aerosaccus]